MRKIKPCPKCRINNMMKRVHIVSRKLPFWWYIKCDNCKACGVTKLFLFRAIKSWNKIPRVGKKGAKNERMDKR